MLYDIGIWYNYGYGYGIESWHVWNFDNREKVRKDEAKYEAEQTVIK